jgi:hypothetical protein
VGVQRHWAWSGCSGGSEELLAERGGATSNCIRRCNCFGHEKYAATKCCDLAACRSRRHVPERSCHRPHTRSDTMVDVVCLYMCLPTKGKCAEHMSGSDAAHELRVCTLHLHLQQSIQQAYSAFLCTQAHRSDKSMITTSWKRLRVPHTCIEASTCSAVRKDSRETPDSCRDDRLQLSQVHRSRKTCTNKERLDSDVRYAVNAHCPGWGWPDCEPMHGAQTWELKPHAPLLPFHTLSAHDSCQAR